MAYIHTTHGALGDQDFDRALPHEHIFIETGEGAAYAYLMADMNDAQHVMVPFLMEARALGVGLLCEATPEGVGRRADIVARIAHAAGLPVAIATGFYREPWITQETHAADIDMLAVHMTKELTDGIAGAECAAGFIKVGTSPTGVTACEEKIIRAACRAALVTGSAICSHTTDAAGAHRILDIFAEEGIAASRFVWYHASAETDMDRLLAVARRGCFLSLDDTPGHMPPVLPLVEHGFVSKILLSMDAGWYNPRHPKGGHVRPYTSLFDTLLPQLERDGVPNDTLRAITHDNVFAAFGR